MKNVLNENFYRERGHKRYKLRVNLQSKVFQFFHVQIKGFQVA